MQPAEGTVCVCRDLRACTFLCTLAVSVGGNIATPSSWDRFLVWLNIVCPRQELLSRYGSLSTCPPSPPALPQAPGMDLWVLPAHCVFSNPSPPPMPALLLGRRGSLQFSKCSHSLFLLHSRLPLPTPTSALTHEPTCGGRDLSQVPRRPSESYFPYFRLLGTKNISKARRM